MTTIIKRSQLLILLCVCSFIFGCSHVMVDEELLVSAQQKIVLMPVTNYSQTPQSGEKVEIIIQSLWHQRKLPALTVYPRDLAYDEGLPPLNDYARFDKLQAWLAQQNADYYLTGSVSEWRYKSGLDGEPAVGVSLNMHDASSGAVVWSATSARSGWDRESISATAQKLISEQLDSIENQ